MYDINEVAKLTGVSKVTIYKKLKKMKELEQYIVVKNDKIYVLDEGIKLINSSLQVNKQVNYSVKSEVDEEVASEGISRGLMGSKGLINLLTEQLTEKDRQLREKDKQIEELINLNKNNQILLKQQQDKEINQLKLEEHFQEVDQKLMDLREKMESQKEEKKSFFKFLKK